MPTPHQLREELRSLYPKSPSWRDRVKNMSDKQVLAILFRLRMEKKKKEKK